MKVRFILWVMLAAMVVTACSSDEPITDDGGFWSALVFVGEPVESYASVGDMAAAADLIVVGTVADVTAGREWGDPREAENRVASFLFQVAVDEVVRGDLPADGLSAVTWEYGHPAYSLSQLQARLREDGIVDDRSGEVHAYPTGRVLLFLRVRDDLGSEIAIAPEASFSGDVAYRLVSVGGLVVDSLPNALLPIMGMEADSPQGRQVVEEVESNAFDEVVDLARG